MIPETNTMHLKIEGEQKEVIVRFGEAPPILSPKSLELKGSINTPFEFYAKRVETFDPINAHVILNETTGSISLIVDESIPEYSITATGTLGYSELLKALPINQNKALTTEELCDKLRFAAIHFESKEAHKTLIRKLSNLKIIIKTALEKQNERNGTFKASKEVEIEEKLELGFVMNVPVFVGTPAKRIAVEVQYESTDGGTVKLYLISDDLQALAEEIKQEYFSKAEEVFSELVVVRT